MNDIEWIKELQNRRKEWEKKKKKIINLDLFDKWLNQEVYIRPKYRRTEIITLYKKMVREGKSIIDFENALDKIGWDEITYEKIGRYVSLTNYRFTENNKLEA